MSDKRFLTAVASGALVLTVLIAPAVSASATSTSPLQAASSQVVSPLAIADAPTGLTVQLSGNVPAVSFVPPAAATPAVSGYRVDAVPNDGGPTQPTWGASSPILLRNLTPGQTYAISVVALNADGESAPSSAQAYTYYRRPDPVQSLAAVESPSQIAVSWAAPASDGGRPVLSYVVDLFPLSAGVPVPAEVVLGAGATGTTVTGLTNGVAYNVNVRVTNTIGGSIVAQTSARPVLAPVAPALSLVGGSGVVRASWSAAAPAAAPASYTVVATPASGAPVSVSLPGTSTSAVLTGLPVHTAVSVTVTATNSTGSAHTTRALAVVNASLSASRAIVYGATVTSTGRITTPGGMGVAGATVSIVVLNPSGPSLAGTTTSDATGAYRLTWHPYTPRPYYAVVSGPGLLTATSSQRTQAIALQLTGTTASNLTSIRVRPGVGASLRVQVNPHFAAVPLTLQVSNGNTWRVVRVLSSNTAGVAAATVTIPTAGDYHYRFVSGSYAGYLPGASGTLLVKVI